MISAVFSNADVMAVEKAETERIFLRGVGVFPFSDADRLIDYAQANKGILVAVNAEKIANASPQTKEIINSNIAYCDGAGAVMAARKKGARPTKIAGCELWLRIIERFHTDKTFYIVGARPEVHRATIEKLTAQYPGIKIVGHRDGYLRTEAERTALVDDVVAKRPDVVFVAMGSPVQEILMSEMLKRHKAVYQGLGGSFDVYTGKVKRAPKWWLDHNLEAAYRLLRQPKRIKRDIVYLRFIWWLMLNKF